MGVTSDPNDPRLGFGVDAEPIDQHEVYLVLSPAELEAGFVRPVRTAYQHTTCGAITTMNRAIAETYARDPKFYGATYCCTCRKHLAVDEFVWCDTAGDPTTMVVGS